MANLEGTEPAPPRPLGRKTNAVTTGTPNMWQRYVIMAKP